VRSLVFQLTGLIERAPEYLRTFPANVLIITALPDIHFDEDVRELEARASFKHALKGLSTLAALPIPIGGFLGRNFIQDAENGFLPFALQTGRPGSKG